MNNDIRDNSFENETEYFKEASYFFYKILASVSATDYSLFSFQIYKQIRKNLIKLKSTDA